MDWLDYREKLGIGFCDEKKYDYFTTNLISGLKILIASGCRLSFEEYFNFCATTGTDVETSVCGDKCGNSRLEICVDLISFHKNNFKDLISYYIAFANSMVSIKGSRYSREYFFDFLEKSLRQAHIQYEIIWDDKNGFIFPKGAEELDDKLISEPLMWLESYPKAHKAFIKALKGYSEVTNDNASDVADLFRKALETFFQEFFGGGKSLENYKSDYGLYLKDYNVPKEISGNLETLLQAYTNYMNNFAKHRDATSDTVLEYLMYQTGNIIRLLITLKRGS